MWYPIAAAALTSCRSAPITIRAGLLLDGRGGQLRDALITVSGSRIRRVGPYQGDTVTYDLSRYTVLPGLIDAHVHISSYFNRFGRATGPGDGETPAQQAAGRAANALATLRAGFTTVASMGSSSDRSLRDAINAGSLDGPRILTSLDPLGDASLSPRELRRSLRHLKAGGADFVKIFGANSIEAGGMPSYTLEQLTELCGGAKRVGLRSVVHVESDSSLRLAAAAGCDQVEHAFLATAEGLRVLADRGVRYDPQCGLVFTNYLDNRVRYESTPGLPPRAFPFIERMRPSLPKLLRTALGVPGLEIAYGTDATAGAHGRNAEDLICRVREVGQAPMEALVTATSRNAAGLGLGNRIGTIAPGYQADLIALEGNPLQEIEAVRRVKFVMKGGKIFVPN